MSALFAAIGGVDRRTTVVTFGQVEEARSRAFRRPPDGTPSRDTFPDVFSRIDPERFESCFVGWIGATVPALSGQRPEPTLLKDAETTRS